MATKTFGRSGTASVPAPNVIKGAGKPIPARMYIHLAAGGMALLIAVLAVRGVVTKEDIPQCSERFANGTLMGLQTPAGAPISTADLQGRLAGRDWGVMENVKFATLKDGPAAVAMRIALPKLTGKTDELQPKSGAGFTWLVPRIAEAHSACLTYNILLPSTFNFGSGGILPGLFGGETNDAPSRMAKGAFSLRNAWDTDGTARARIITPEEPDGLGFSIAADGAELPRGQWVRIEQEVVLNHPGSADGLMRLWINGKLLRETTDLVFRTDDGAQFRGVVADVHYGATSPAGTTSAPATTSIMVTPFELRWQ